jgi:hypothetical protein
MEAGSCAAMGHDRQPTSTVVSISIKADSIPKDDYKALLSAAVITDTVYKQRSRVARAFGFAESY